MKKEKKNKDFVHRAYYPGGAAALKAFLKDEIRYPKEAEENGIEGTVHIEFQIDHKGNVTSSKILNSLGYGCDEEADRLVKLLKFEVPKTRKLKVTYRKKLNIHFRKPKQKKTKPVESTPNQVNIQYTIVPTTKEKQDSKNISSYNYTIKY